MTDDDGQDVRFLVQERLVDALIKTLAMEQPRLLSTLHSILVDTEFTHPRKPELGRGLHQQIRERIEAASAFAKEHGSEQIPGGRPERTISVKEDSDG